MIDRKYKSMAGDGGSSDHPGLRQVGALLRKTRVQLGLSLEQVSEATRIPRSHLDSVERGDTASLPPGPFTKGFVTAYARHVSLPEDDIIGMLERGGGELPSRQDEPDDQGEGEGEPGVAKGLSSRQMALVGGGSVTGLVAALLLFGGSDHEVLPTQPAIPPLVLEPNVEGGPQATADRVVRGASVEGEDGTRWVVFSDLEPDGAGHRVEVKAHHRTYLKVSNDLSGDVMWEDILEEGATETFSSPTELWMIFGNGGAVEVTYDGVALKELAEDGDRRALAFRSQ